MEKDPDFLPVSLAVVVHCDPLEAKQILRYIHEVVEARIVYKTIAPKGERLWIKREVHPNNQRRGFD